MTEAPEKDTWRLDKHIPLALIFTLIFQGAFGVWWISSINSQIQIHEQRLNKIEAFLEKQGEALAVINVRLARIEQTLENISVRVTPPIKR